RGNRRAARTTSPPATPGRHKLALSPPKWARNVAPKPAPLSARSCHFAAEMTRPTQKIARLTNQRRGAEGRAVARASLRGKNEKIRARTMPDRAARTTQPRNLKAFVRSEDSMAHQGRKCRRPIISAMSPIDQMLSAPRNEKTAVSDRFQTEMSYINLQTPSAKSALPKGRKIRNGSNSITILSRSTMKAKKCTTRIFELPVRLAYWIGK